MSTGMQMCWHYLPKRYFEWQNIRWKYGIYMGWKIGWHASGTCRKTSRMYFMLWIEHGWISFILSMQYKFLHSCYGDMHFYYAMHEGCQGLWSFHLSTWELSSTEHTFHSSLETSWFSIFCFSNYIYSRISNIIHFSKVFS